MDHLECNKIITDFQYGFRQKQNCESQLITTIRDITNSLNKSSQVDDILLDFSKVFDKLDHTVLFFKTAAILHKNDFAQMFAPPLNLLGYLTPQKSQSSSARPS